VRSAFEHPPVANHVAVWFDASQCRDDHVRSCKDEVIYEQGPVGIRHSGAV
jgi:hypothetical protein